MQEEKTQQMTPRSNRVLTVVGIVLCVILIPILIVNCTLLIKGALYKDKVPSFLSISPLIILSGSMEDEFPTGSMIFIKEAEASEIAEGDIISYFDPASRSDAVETHKVRFVETTDEGKLVFYTYGTFNVKKDFADVTKEDCQMIPAEKLVGKYTGICFEGLGDFAIFMQSTPGLLICILIPLILLISYDAIRRRIYDKQKAIEKAELMRELEELRQKESGEEGHSQL